MDQATTEIVKKAWAVPVQGSYAFQTIQHQKFVIQHLQNWNNLPQRSLAAQITRVRAQLTELQSRPDLLLFHIEEKLLRQHLGELLQKQEIYWTQRA